MLNNNKNIKQLVKNTVVYNLPLIEGFHAHKKLDIRPKNRKAIFKNFGLNYWDLLENGTLEKSKYAGFGLLDVGSLHIDLSNSPGVLLMNCSKTDMISVKNEESGDIYNIGPLGIVKYNMYGKDIISAKVSNTSNLKTFVRSRSSSRNRNRKISSKYGLVNEITIEKLEKTLDSNSVWVHCIRFGDAFYIFLKIEDIINGLTRSTDLPVFHNILLCSGIIDEDLYLKSTSLNWHLIKTSYDEHENIYLDSEQFMQEYIELLMDQWDKVNPSTVVKESNRIPHKIHWIWLSYNLGPSPYKESGPSSVVEFEQFMKTWVIRNPSFEFNVWTNSKELTLPSSIKDKIVIRNLNDINTTIDLLKKTKLKNIHKKIFNMIHNHPNVGIRSDTLRQTILYTIGGLYADINDMACLVPFEPFLDSFDFIAGLEPIMYVNNAIVGSRKDYKISERFLKSIAYETDVIFSDYVGPKKKYDNEEEKNKDKEDIDNFVVSHTGPIAFSSVIFGSLSDAKEENSNYYERACIFPAKFMYSNYQITEDSCSWLSPFSIGCHYDQRSFTII